jgi:lia operon protein LiaG
MKKLGFGLFLIMVILFAGVAFIFYTEGADAFSTKVVKIHEEHSLDGEDLNEIQIKTSSTDVKVLPHSKAEVKVELNGEVSEKLKDAFELEVSELNGLLHVELHRKTRPSFTVFAINKGAALTILLPSKMYKEILVQSTSGDIDANDVSSNRINLKATSGDIKAENLVANSNLSIESTSGDVESLRNSGDHLMYKATSGDVSITTGSQSFTVDFKGASGDGEVDVPGFLFEELSEERILGKIGKGEQAITVRTTSGDFSLQ